jgi:hypothetical protein
MKRSRVSFLHSERHIEHLRVAQTIEQVEQDTGATFLRHCVMPVRVVRLNYQRFRGIHVAGDSLEIFSTNRSAFEQKFERAMWGDEIKGEANSAFSCCRWFLVRDESVSSDVDDVNQQRRFINLGCTRQSNAHLGTLT